MVLTQQLIDRLVARISKKNFEGCLWCQVEPSERTRAVQDLCGELESVRAELHQSVFRRFVEIYEKKEEKDHDIDYRLRIGLTPNGRVCVQLMGGCTSVQKVRDALRKALEE